MKKVILLILILFNLSIYSQEVGVVANFPFNGSATSTLNGEFFGTNQTIFNYVADRNGVAGQALSRTTNFTTAFFPNNNLPSGTAARTVSLWVRKTGQPGSLGIFEYGNGSSFSGFLMGFTHMPFSPVSSFDFGVPPSNIQTTNFTIADGVWYHYVVTTNPSGIVKQYVNGVSIGTFSFVINTAVTPSCLLGGFYNGAVDDLKIYNREISAVEVSNLFNFNSTQAPVVSAPSITNVFAFGTSNSGFVNYSVNANNAATSSLIRYGTVSGNLTSTVAGFLASGNTILPGTASIPNLLPGTQYFYRVEATNSVGTTLGQELSFTTTGGFAVLTFSNLTSSAITATTATVSVDVANVCIGSNYRLQYNTSNTFLAGTVDTPHTTDNINGTKNHNITGLLPNTQYFFRYYSSPNQGCGNTSQITSATASFTTLSAPSVTSPSITAISSTNITTTAATINYSLNANNAITGSVVRYGLISGNLSSSITSFSASGNTNTPGNIVLSGLSSNTQYFYRIEATNSAGTTQSTVGNFTTLAAIVVSAPSITSVSSSSTSNSGIVNYSLNANNAVTSSLIRYGTVSGNLTITVAGFVANGNTVLPGSAPIPNLLPGTQYFYRVEASNSAGTTLGLQLSFTTLPSTVVSTPSITSVSSSSTSNSGIINYSLNANNAATSSLIRYGTVNGNLTITVPGFVANGNTVLPGSASIPNLLSGTQYFYRVEATNSAGTTLGQEQSFTTTGTVAVIAFSNLTATAITNTTATVSVTLANVCATASYQLQRSTSDTFVVNVVDTQFSSGGTIGVKNHNLTGLAPNTLYYYRFYASPNQACNAAQIVSVTANFTTSAPLVVSAPSISSVSSSSTSTSGIINYSLNANNAPTLSVIRYGTVINNLTSAVTGFAANGNTISPSSVSIPGLLSNLQYFYRVEATNSAGTTLGPQLSFITLPSILVSAPSIFSVSSTSTINSGIINYSLNANNAVTSSLIRFGTVSGNLTSTVAGFTANGNTISLGDATITGLIPSTQYFYRVEATNSAGTSLGQQQSFTTSNAGEITFSNLTSSAITGTTATVSVTLANVCATASYQLQRSTSDTFTVNVVDTQFSSGGTNGVKNHNLTGLAPNTLYYYRFYASPNQACNAAEIVSVTANFTTLSAASVTSPSITAISSTNITTTAATINYSLNANNAITGSVVRYGLTSGNLSSSITSFSASGNTNIPGNIVLSGLSSNTQYFYRIEATNSAGITQSAILSFTTSSAVAVLTFANLTSSAITGTTATVSVLLTNVCPTASYQLQRSTSDTFTVNVVDTQFSSGGTNGVKNHNLTGLAPNTLYYFRFYASPNQACNTAEIVSVTATFTTLSASLIPTFTQVGPICAGGGFGLPGTSNNNISGTWSPMLSNAVTTTYTFTPDPGQNASTVTMTVTINQNVTPAFAAIAPICSGATLAALPTTSTNGITGTWSPALNNTATTTYTFTPTAGLCAPSVTRTITVNQNVTPAFAAIAPICSGGTLAALPTTSTNGITGTWSPALNNTATTTYIFTPTAGLCASSVTRTITVNQNVTPAFAAIAPICSGGTLAALPTTSTNGITGTWSPALNNTATTTYTFTPTAGLCAPSVTRTITVNQNVTPAFAAIAPICSGGTLAALPTTSTNGITGTWSPALNNTATTTYTFTPTAGLCAPSVTRTITVNPNVTPTFTQVAPICSGTTTSPLLLTSTNGITGTWSPAFNNTATTTYTFTPSAGQCATGTVTMVITISSSVTATFTQISPVCLGSASSALPTTSNNGVVGNWSPTLINTAVTTSYVFTPNAGQCATATASMTITVSPNVTPAFAAVAPICSGGTLAALPTTSTNGITGTWSPALNNTATTTYTFTPTAGLCAPSVTRTITVNQNVTPAFAAIAPICSGGTLAALPTTSTNGITGTWSPALNNTATTTYTFTPTAGLCASSVTRTITVSQNVPTAFAAIAPICSGGTLAALPTTSTNGIIGTWSPALNNTATTIYTFTPNAGQCASPASLIIVVNSAATPTSAGSQTFVQGATIASLVASPSNVIWYASTADANSGNNPLPTTTLLVNLITYYAVNVVGTCRSTAVAVTVSITLDTDTFYKARIVLYPNPVVDILNIDSTTEITSIEIYNIQGQKVLSATQKQINLLNLPSGMYMIRIQDSENAITTKKFMKN